VEAVYWRFCCGNAASGRSAILNGDIEKRFGGEAFKWFGMKKGNIQLG